MVENVHADERADRRCEPDSEKRRFRNAPIVLFRFTFINEKYNKRSGIYADPCDQNEPDVIENELREEAC